MIRSIRSNIARFAVRAARGVILRASDHSGQEVVQFTKIKLRFKRDHEGFYFFCHGSGFSHGDWVRPIWGSPPGGGDSGANDPEADSFELADKRPLTSGWPGDAGWFCANLPAADAKEPDSSGNESSIASDASDSILSASSSILRVHRNQTSSRQQ